MKNSVKSELAFASSLFLISLVVVFDTSRSTNPVINVSVSPKLFPNIVGFFLMALSTFLIIQILRGQAATPEGMEAGEEIERSNFKSFGLVLSSIILFTLVVQRAGFVIATALTFFGITLAFSVVNKLKSFTIAFVFSLVVYEIFTRFLNVDLPAGWLKFL